MALAVSPPCDLQTGACKKAIWRHIFWLTMWMVTIICMDIMLEHSMYTLRYLKLIKGTFHQAYQLFFQYITPFQIFNPSPVIQNWQLRIWDTYCIKVPKRYLKPTHILLVAYVVVNKNMSSEVELTAIES